MSAVADVAAGFPVRSTGRPDGARRLRLLGLADLAEDRVREATSSADWVDLDEKDQARFALRQGDVLVAARGSQPKVALVTADVLPAVASANLLVVRPQRRQMAGVVFAYLRSPGGLALVAGLSRSTAGQLSISARDIASLEVPVPPIHVQAQVTDLVEAGEVGYAAALAAAAERRAAVHAVALNLIRNTSL